MNNKEKIGQMLILGFKGTSLKASDPIAKAILNRQIGGVILFGYNVEKPEQLKLLTGQLQQFALQAGSPPLFIAVDYEGGRVNRLKESAGFPKTLSAASIGKLSFTSAQQYAEQMANTLQQAGININLAPVVDVNLNPNNPVIGKLERSFSDDPSEVADYATVFCQAHQKRNIICALKHFPGHGSSTGDTHNEAVDVTKTWQQNELVPYEQLLNNHDIHSMVMTSHVVHLGLDRDGYPASLSAAMTKKILRESLNFQGLVITDDLQMRAITDNYSLNDTLRLAVNAGADLLIFGNQLSSVAQNPEELIDIICCDIDSGHISEAAIEESFQRIDHYKKHLTFSKSTGISSVHD